MTAMDVQCRAAALQGGRVAPPTRRRSGSGDLSWEVPREVERADLILAPAEPDTAEKEGPTVGSSPKSLNDPKHTPVPAAEPVDWLTDQVGAVADREFPAECTTSVRCTREIGRSPSALLIGFGATRSDGLEGDTGRRPR